MSVRNHFDFSVKTDVFEGPLELLIELCEKRKLLINDISLAAITDDYIARVNEMQERSLPHTAQFVQLAATLLLIKSKSLLPTLELTKEEEATIDDLEDRLRQYQIYREAGAALAQRFGNAIMYEPQFVTPADPLFIPDEWCSLPKLRAAMAHVIANLPMKEEKPKVRVKPTISLEDMITSLKRRIESHIKVRFSDMRKEADEHKTVIVGFLAILELVRHGNLLATQPTRFADIEIEVREGSVLRYY